MRPRGRLFLSDESRPDPPLGGCPADSAGPHDAGPCGTMGTGGVRGGPRGPGLAPDDLNFSRSISGRCRELALELRTLGWNLELPLSPLIAHRRFPETGSHFRVRCSNSARSALHCFEKRKLEQDHSGLVGDLEELSSQDPGRRTRSPSGRERRPCRLPMPGRRS